MLSQHKGLGLGILLAALVFVFGVLFTSNRDTVLAQGPATPRAASSTVPIYLPLLLRQEPPHPLSVTAGLFHTCTLLSTGAVKCWGDDSNAQIGDGYEGGSRTTPVSVLSTFGGSPISGITAIAAGVYHSCLITSSTKVQCWGDNVSGQLGNGSVGTDSTVPRDVSPGTVVVGSALTGATAVGAGEYFSCALLASGSVACWGSNSKGQLGDGTTTQRPSPVKVSGLTGATAIALGDDFACALLAAGTVKCWGNNNFGQLGDGTTTQHSLPVDVIGLSGVRQISANSYGSTVCALLSSGGIKCWGSNYYGALGDGTRTNHPTPVDVTGLTSGVASIGTGGGFTCAVLDSGGAKCWGANYYGQLGNGIANRVSCGDDPFQHMTQWCNLTPVDVSGLSSGVSAIGGGGYHACAILQNGGLRCWGYNKLGEIGNGGATGACGTNWYGANIECVPTPTQVAGF